MLLLYLVMVQELMLPENIYIPLCFYFIPYTVTVPVLHGSFTFHYASTLSVPQILDQVLDSHLHSTMLLLYPIMTAMRGCPAMLIYIPLCFYFIVSDRQDAQIVTIIYIPLCFYFIEIFDHSVVPAVDHLHSTMLLLYLGANCPISCAIKFTFHYASTLSHFFCKPNVSITDLHSTMLLLYRGSW